MKPFFSRDKVALFLCLFIAACASYYTVLNSSYQGDDFGRIVSLDEEKVGHFHYLPEYGQGFLSSIKWIMPDRPVLFASIWLNTIITGPDNIWFMKLTNVFLHVIVAFLIYICILGFPNRSFKISHTALAALLLIFVVHPINSQAINIIVQRGVILSALFAMLSFICFQYYLQKINYKFLALSVFMLFFSMLSKPNSVFIIAVFALYQVFFYSSKKIFISILPFSFVFLPALYFYLVVGIDNEPAWMRLSNWDYFLVSNRVLQNYFLKFLLPVNLATIYVPVVPKIWPLLANLCIFSAIYFAVRRDKVLSFLCLSLLLSFVPETSIFTIRFTEIDYRFYFGFIFLIMIAYYLGQNISKKKYLAICLILPMLIALNNFNASKTNTLEKWFQYNFSNYDGVHGFNRNYIEMLTYWGTESEVKALVEPLHEKFPDYYFYEIILNYLNLQDLSKFSSMMAADKLLYADRNFLNNYYFREANKRYQKIDLIINLEKHYRHQLANYFQEYKYASRSIGIYRNLHKQVLKFLFSQKRSSENDEQIVSLLVTGKKYLALEPMKIIHFNPQYQDLLTQINQALAK